MTAKLVVAVIFVCLGVLVAGGCLTQPSQQDRAIHEIFMSTGDMTQQIQTNNIDAFVAWEPIPSQVALDGTGTILAYSGAIWPDNPCCIIAVSQNALAKLDNNTVLGMVWAHVKATQFINDPKNYNETIQYLMNDTGVDYNTARESLNHTKYFDMPSTKAVREVYGGLANASYLSANVGALGNSSMNQFLDTFVLSDYVNTVHAKLAADPNWKPPAVNATVQLGLLQTDSHKLAAVIALDKGFYSSLGLNVVVKHYANGVALVEGFKTGDIDMGYLGLAPALLKAINDDVKINVIAGVNNEGSAVVVKPSGGITQLAELAGKHVATPGAGTVQDLLLRMLAEENHIKIVTK